MLSILLTEDKTRKKVKLSQTCLIVIPHVSEGYAAVIYKVLMRYEHTKLFFFFSWFSLFIFDLF